MSSRTCFGEAISPLFRLDGPTAVSAGAGSGKTTALIELCLRLFSGEATGVVCEPWEIAAITFTEKAALELRERLRKAVESRAVAEAGVDPGSSDWSARLQALDRMLVGTIHSFAARLLRDHALEAGVDPEFAIADEERASGWRRDAARRAVIAAVDSGQSEAVSLCAAHGIGGGRGLASIVAELLTTRARLGLTGPVEPTPDCREEIDATRSRLNDLVDRLVATEKGGAGLDRLREVASHLTYDDRTGEPAPASLRRFEEIGSAIGSWRVKKSDVEGAAAKAEIREVAEALVELTAEFLSSPQKRGLSIMVEEAESLYASQKTAERALDFDDLLVRACGLLRNDAGLRREVRSRMRALLVDEYQDVNGLQQELFDLVAGDDTSGSGPTLVAVGDLKQSIYRFRGADVAVFAGLIDRFGSGSKGRVLRLTENYRSAPAVLDWVNGVFERCLLPTGDPPRPYEIRFTKEDRLVAARTGGMEVACEILDDDGEGNAEARREREARAIARRIASLVDGVSGVKVRERGADGAEQARSPRWGDMALLFRRLTQVSVYEKALRDAGIPCRLTRGGGFYRAPEVRDLGELLASLFDPDDSVAWAAILRSPLCGISDGSLFLLGQRGLGSLRVKSPAKVVEELRLDWNTPSSETSDKIDHSELARLEHFLHEWQALFALRDRLPLPDLLERSLARLDVEAALLAAPGGERRFANVRKAVVLARRFGDAGGTAPQFAERLRRLAASPPREPEADLETGDTVTLLTIHQAKGLEWPIVFVPDLCGRSRGEWARALFDSQGRICTDFYDPTRETFHRTRSVSEAISEQTRAAAAESRRLFYVALTRARDYLVLSGDDPRSGSRETWRGFAEAAAEAHPALVKRVRVCDQLSTLPEGTVVGGEIRTSQKTSPHPIPLSLKREGGSDSSAHRGLTRIAVTDLVEYARCPRRHHLSRNMRLPESIPDGGRSTQDDPARATSRGTLAHAMLAEVDLRAPPLERWSQLGFAATRRGYDPENAGVRRILLDVARFLESPAGSRLAGSARAGALRRELPFLMRIDGEEAGCYLAGTIDAMLEHDGGLEVIDFKYALPDPRVAEEYRFQLLAYLLATSRALPGRKKRATVQFLRGNCAAFDMTPTDSEIEQFATGLPALVGGLLGGNGDRFPDGLGRTEEKCRREGCGYLLRCYGKHESSRHR